MLHTAQCHQPSNTRPAFLSSKIAEIFLVDWPPMVKYLFLLFAERTYPLRSLRCLGHPIAANECCPYSPQQIIRRCRLRHGPTSEKFAEISGSPIASPSN